MLYQSLHELYTSEKSLAPANHVTNYDFLLQVMGPADLAEYRAPLASMEGRRMQLLLLVVLLTTFSAF
jgi:hypothetical protein